MIHYLPLRGKCRGSINEHVCSYLYIYSDKYKCSEVRIIRLPYNAWFCFKESVRLLYHRIFGWQLPLRESRSHSEQTDYQGFLKACKFKGLSPNLQSFRMIRVVSNAMLQAEQPLFSQSWKKWFLYLLSRTLQQWSFQSPLCCLSSSSSYQRISSWGPCLLDTTSHVTQRRRGSLTKIGT